MTALDVVHSGAAITPDPSELAATMQNDPEIPRLVGVSDAAKILGLVRQRVWQLIEEGELPAVKPARDYLMREQIVREYKARMDLERRSQEAGA